MNNIKLKKEYFNRTKEIIKDKIIKDLNIFENTIMLKNNYILIYKPKYNIKQLINDLNNIIEEFNKNNNRFKYIIKKR